MQNFFGKSRLLKFLARMGRDQRGVSAVFFAISFAALTPVAMSMFDVYQSNEQRGKLQDALDAAALYVAHSSATLPADVNTLGTKALGANLQLIKGATLTSANFTLENNTKIEASAQVQMSAFAPMAFTHSPVNVSAEVTRGGNNIEVSMVLDNTGSMSGSPLTSLQTAANQLIDLVVSANQTPYYSKMAIVPYSNSVNAGAYVNTVRGTAGSGTGNNVTGLSNIKFTSASGSTDTFGVSSCVSERTGAQAFTDASYASAPVGWVYPPSSGDNPCISASIQPLTSNNSALHTIISSLTAGGSTAGHIGVAWGWYTISPNWAGLFPAASQPAAYGTQHLLKVMVLMTDGAFNTAYCNGVVSNVSSATDGSSGSANEHSTCASPNTDSFTQAQTLCTAMKAPPNNIIIYTVGFLHGGADPQATAILNNCATDASHAYFPTTGSDLQLAFQAIGANINQLRISH